MTATLVFATRNRGKLVELRRLLAAADLEILDLDQAGARIGRDLGEVDEDADTFLGNATKKAVEISRATGLPALADDSGLEVDALGGAPGVYSARYAGGHGDSAANNAKLLAALAGHTDRAARTARFRAVLAFADTAGRLGAQTITADGVCEGAITEAARGAGGFGYDPIFEVAGDGRTMAELGTDEKAAISHRGKAMRAIEAQLLGYLRGT